MMQAFEFVAIRRLEADFLDRRVVAVDVRSRFSAGAWWAPN
jgi:hypothetical protein